MSDDLSISYNNYVTSHSRFVDAMDCNTISNMSLFTVYINMYNGVSLDIGRSNDDIAHIVANNTTINVTYTERTVFMI